MLSLQRNGGWKAELTLAARASKSSLGHQANNQMVCRLLKSCMIDISLANTTPSEGSELEHGTYSDDVRMFEEQLGVDDDEAQLGRRLVNSGRDEA